MVFGWTLPEVYSAGKLPCNGDQMNVCKGRTLMMQTSLLRKCSSLRQRNQKLEGIISLLETILYILLSWKYLHHSPCWPPWWRGLLVWPRCSPWRPPSAQTRRVLTRVLASLSWSRNCRWESCRPAGTRGRGRHCRLAGRAPAHTAVRHSRLNNMVSETISESSRILSTIESS